jgi:hypothetical protein
LYSFIEYLVLFLSTVILATQDFYLLLSPHQVDKLNAEANWIEMPPLSSVEDMDNHPEFVNRFRNNSQRN